MTELHLETLTAAIEEQLRQKPFSGVIHISLQSKEVFSHAYGLANRSDNLPNRLNTRFGIASGGKVFTAAAIGQLAQEDKLSFEQPLSEFLDGALPLLDPTVTLKHLLCHTSGVPDYFDEEVEDDYEAYWKDKPVYNMRCAADFIALIRDLPMKFTPGDHFAYNNAGFVLLGAVVEKVSGKRFQDYVEERVFGPAWMRSSGYFFSDRMPADCAQGYIEEADGSWRSNVFAVPVVGHGDGGTFTNAADMGRFWKAFFEKTYFKEELLAEMIAPQAKVSEDGVYQYGLGLWINDVAPERFYYVVGDDPGVNFLSGVYPNSGLQITLLANGNDVLWPLHKVIRAEIFGLGE
jgi:CubicO group peptidase (beta-lactamase class C family)